ncbi:MAG: ParB/RepB/Spo0J family partition protein [Acidovorax sp.]|uniref:ParB/RepB/Spo0J family partition protein n=1 Tax=Acidovorax sp. TaxID=1872122 RepID=UPI0026105D43|nr:ParB/RepB/Spo0J family partition protein [Acidovorax sp.]MDH4463120.1 ParB/RepB/Spo0J family partition protein [Acidovorax sp.]
MSANPYATTQQVPIADIIRRPGWQVRRGLTVSTIDRYAATYKAGGSMAPVTLARVGGVLLLIDGAHRLEALQQTGREVVEAVVNTMTETQAEWAAASANLEHGLPLKKAELREVFRHYIATGQHRIKRGRVKSLRDIAKELPGVGYVTVRSWLMKDHPELYRKSYAGSGAEGHSHGGQMEVKRPTQRERDLQACEEHIKQLTGLMAIISRADRERVARSWQQHSEPLLKKPVPASTA